MWSCVNESDVNLIAEKTAHGRNSPGRTTKDSVEELDQVAGNAEDEIGDRIAAMRETEILYGVDSLLAAFGPMLVHICGSPHKFKVCAIYCALRSLTRNRRIVRSELRPPLLSANFSALVHNSVTHTTHYFSAFWRRPKILASEATSSSLWVMSLCPSAVSSMRTAMNSTKASQTKTLSSRKTLSWC